jgi:hypothetical protein
MTLGGCKTGEAKVTRGYLLPSKHVIHAVGPIWQGGKNGERELLYSAYKNSFRLAVELGCETLAMPLISSGAYGFPRALALKIAVDSVRELLREHEMTVYLTVFDRESFETGNLIERDIKEYIDDNYVGLFGMQSREMYRKASTSIKPKICKMDSIVCESNIPFSASLDSREDEIGALLGNMDDSFAVTLLKLIDKKGMTDVECYKKANVSKQTWYKIINEKDYRPSKMTVICFAVALSLTLDETTALLETVGYAFSHSYRFDVAIEYFIKNGIYDIFIINELLFKFDLPCLGV